MDGWWKLFGCDVRCTQKWQTIELNELFSASKKTKCLIINPKNNENKPSTRSFQEYTIAPNVHEIYFIICLSVTCLISKINERSENTLIVSSISPKTTQIACAFFCPKHRKCIALPRPYFKCKCNIKHHQNTQIRKVVNNSILLSFIYTNSVRKYIFDRSQYLLIRISVIWFITKLQKVSGFCQYTGDTSNY
jgi:hypothetical protein